MASDIETFARSNYNSSKSKVPNMSTLFPMAVCFFSKRAPFHDDSMLWCQKWIKSWQYIPQSHITNFQTSGLLSSVYIGQDMRYFSIFKWTRNLGYTIVWWRTYMKSVHKLAQTLYIDPMSETWYSKGLNAEYIGQILNYSKIYWKYVFEHTYSERFSKCNFRPFLSPIIPKTVMNLTMV